jgi:hypothetical protein
VANKKKALRASPFDEEIEASIFGRFPAEPARMARKKTGKVAIEQENKEAIEQRGNVESYEAGKEPMEKIAMRLPKSLAVEFQQVYLQLAAWHLETHGKKLYVQDCHVEAMRDWIEKQKRKLGK